MTKWMGELEMKIEIETDWRVNSPMIIRGFHHVEFENKGNYTSIRQRKTIKLQPSEFHIQITGTKQRTIQFSNSH
jgi:bisphosphoglycerate-dependent phosphoglycerate mutase